MKTQNIIFRILTSPFVLGIFTVYYSLNLIRAVIMWILNGGEIMTYANDTRVCMTKIYEELKKQSEI
jgi:hypothetical protein